MKILFVTATFPPRKFGGITAVTHILSKKLVERGHEVTVYTTDLGDSPNSRLNVKTRNIDGANVYYFKNISNKLSFNQRLFSPVGMMFKLKKEIKKFDVIHLHDYRSFLSIIVHHYAKKNEVPYIVQPHGSLPHLKQKSFLKSVFDVFWGLNIIKDAEKLIALNSRELKQYLEMGAQPDKIEIVPNGIDLSVYNPLPEKGRFKKKYDINNDQKIVLYLSRINKIKGPDLLIKSFAELLKDLKNIKLMIVGPDEGFKQYLEELLEDLVISDRVIFTGPLYGENKLEAYVDADVYVLPSIYETFPNTVIESCACGTPVVITDRCGISDMINDKVGLVVEYDKNSLKEGLKHMLQDDVLREKFEFECKAFVEKHFNIDSVIDKLETVYLNSKEL